MEGLITDQEIVDLLLVWCAFKPTAMIELSYYPRSKFSRKDFLEKTGELEKIFKKIGFHYQLYINHPKNKKEITRYSCVARSEKKLNELLAAYSEKNIKVRRLKLGALLGYPVTAVRAFANGTSLRLEDLPTSILRKDELKFLNFRLSKHWDAELAYLKRKAETIRKVAPDFFTKIINKPKKVYSPKILRNPSATSTRFSVASGVL